MASSSLANFLSIFIPSKAPPQPAPKAPPSNLPLSTDSYSSQKKRDGFSPMVAATHSSSSSLHSCPDDLMSVVCPSLAYANTLYFSTGYNVQIIVDENEPEERLLGRFRREVMRAGIIQECRRRRFFENKQEEKKRRNRDAAKRNRRRRTPFRGTNATQDKEETGSTKAKRDEDDNDNWEMPGAGDVSPLG